MLMGWYRKELESKCGTAGACAKVIEETVPGQVYTVLESQKRDATRVFGWAVKELYNMGMPVPT
jgi:hypothetical protein